MRGDDFAGQDLRSVKLRGVDLRNCRLVGCDLRGVDLAGANLSDADLTDADLTGANLLGAIMIGTRGAMRNGGRVVSILGLTYPVVIDGDYMYFCQDVKVRHRGRDSLDREELLRMDKRRALKFYALGVELLKWYRG